MKKLPTIGSCNILFGGGLLLIACLAGTPASARKLRAAQPTQTVIVRHDRLNPAPSHAVQIQGFVGHKLDLCIENRLMAQDIDRVVQPFRDRPDGTGGFRSEFWGKWFTAASLAYGYQPTPAHRAVVDEAVAQLVATQDSTGYIGTYLPENHLGDWDVWGRKYVMLGLISHYRETGDQTALQAACRVADHLIQEAGPESGINIAATGWIGWKGLAPSSVLEPIALLYQITGQERYLNFAQHIIACWDTPNRLTPTGIHLIQEALNDTPMWQMSGAPKAYEMMSCFEGLCELYRATGEQTYIDACRHLIDNIRQNELMIVGSASMAEIWCHGRMRQTEPMYQGMETCVTATWMKFLYQMLRLTGDCKYADDLETSLYNACLASMTPQGQWWSYYTGLSGERVPSHQQFGDVGLSCCVANGPRGLMTLPSWAVMTSSHGLAVNFYGTLQAQLPTPGGQLASLSMQSQYPVDGDIRITLDNLPAPEQMDITLRIPHWSQANSILVNGEPVDLYVTSGSWATLHRRWKQGDVILLSLDMRGRVVPAPSGIGDAAITHGPLVLAFDTRLVPRRDAVDAPPMYRYTFVHDNQRYTDLRTTSVHTEDGAIWMTFEVPVADESGATHTLPMCDYQSAGNTWQEGNLFRVWMQQPFDFRHLYTNNLDWHTNVTVGVGRPQIPDVPKKEK